jgi:Ca2+-binding EF-hand superfamily protein
MGTVGSCIDQKGTSTGADILKRAANADKRAVKWSKAIKFQHTTSEFNRQIVMRKELIDGLFSLIDQNNDGQLELDELAKLMPNAKEFISVVDTNADSLISSKEFKMWSDRYIVRYLPDIEVDRMNKLCVLAAMGKKKKNGLEVKATELFDSMDIDSDGFLTLVEIQSVLGQDATQFIQTLDVISSDGKISRDEFDKWATKGGGEYDSLNVQLLKMNDEALRGVLQLYTSTAQKLAKAEPGVGAAGPPRK